MRNSLVAAGAAVALAWSATGHVEGTATGVLPPEPYNIVTVVGSGTDTGNGGLAIAAHLEIPSAVAFDSLGNLYIAESGRHRVRKVNKATGIITTVAGTGEAAFPGYIGENIPATSARITGPVRVVFDRADNLYINGGTGSNRIHKVDAVSELITTVVGHLNGEACPASAFPSCGDGNRATDAWVTGAPRGSVFDAEGNFYFSDTNINRVRKVAAGRSGLDGTETITGVAGTGDAGYDDDIQATSARLNSPRGLALDPSGENLYIADSSNHRVRKVNLVTGIITTPVGIGTACVTSTDLCGDGSPAASAALVNPTNVAFDSLGNMYVNQANHRIRKVDTSGIISTVAGTGLQGFAGDGGPAELALLNSPRGGGIDRADNFYIADAINNRIRRLNVAASVELRADTLNRVTAYIQLPASRDASLVNIDSVRVQAIEPSDGSVRVSTTGEGLQAGRAPDAPPTFPAANQLVLRFDRATVASWAESGAEVVLRIEGQFDTGKYFSGDAAFDVTAPTLIGVPSSQTLHAASAAGAPFAFGPVTAVDEGSGVASVGCDHAGGMFPIGITLVTCTATGDTGSSTTATFTITVTNAPPVAVADAVSTPERVPVSIAVLANDTDPEGDAIAITGITAPGYGAVTADAAGVLTYTPIGGFAGTDSFAYTIDDGRGATASATVTITVMSAGQTASVTMKMRSTPEGSVLWFNSVAQVRGARAGSHLYVTAGTVTFAGTVVAVPGAVITFAAAGTLATTSFDTAYNVWRITVPSTFGDNIFLAGLSYLLPASIGNSTQTTWTARYSTDTAGLTLQWKAAAAAYPASNFGAYNALGIKTLHATSGDAYPNGDQAGTPEAFKKFVIAGGTGGGGSNATGGYSGTASVTPFVK